MNKTTKEKLKNCFFTLKTARELNRLTLQEAAKKLNISYSLLSKYERGERSPTISTMQRLEELYQIPSDRLFFLSEEDFKEALAIINHS